MHGDFLISKLGAAECVETPPGGIWPARVARAPVHWAADFIRLRSISVVVLKARAPDITRMKF